MEITLSFAGLRFRFQSERSLCVEPELLNFIVPNAGADVMVRISWDWDHFSLPETPALGEDAICRYYRQGEQLYCLTRGGLKGPVACARYDGSYRDILCMLNEKPFLLPTQNLGSILRMIPLRAAFLHFGVLFFHASQIAVNGCGILYGAPSGTGKTTQALLWQQYRDAEIVCNDRTLIRRVDGVWSTFGYPLDGSEPVRSSAVNPLGAVVLLEQGSGNTVTRLKPSKSLPRLMHQAVMDCWSSDARTGTMALLMELVGEIPVYLLTCTPTREAVETLEAALKQDGVIPHG